MRQVGSFDESRVGRHHGVCADIYRRGCKHGVEGAQAL